MRPHAPATVEQDHRWTWTVVVGADLDRVWLKPGPAGGEGVHGRTLAFAKPNDSHAQAESDRVASDSALNALKQ